MSTYVYDLRKCAQRYVFRSALSGAHSCTVQAIGDVTWNASQRRFIFSETQLCNIVAALFGIVTTFLQVCSP